MATTKGFGPRGYLFALGLAVLNIAVSTLFPLLIVPIANGLITLSGGTPPPFLSDPVIGFFIAALVFVALLTFEAVVFLAGRLAGSEQNISSLVQQRLEDGFRTSATIRLMAQIARAREIDESESQLIDGAVSTFIGQIERLSAPLSLASLWLMNARIATFMNDVTALQRGDPLAMSVQEQINLSTFLCSLSTRYMLVESFVHEGGSKNWTAGFRRFCEQLEKNRGLTKTYCLFVSHDEIRKRANDVRDIIAYFERYGIEVMVCEPERLLDAFSLEKVPSTAFEYFEGPKGRLIAHYETDGKGYKGGKSLNVSLIERTKGSQWDKAISATMDFADCASGCLDTANQQP